MKASFFKYIVLGIFCFNIAAVQAADIEFNPYDDENYWQPDAVVGALNLPHAADMRRILQENSEDSIGRMLLLGKYFDSKYAGEKINTDFSDDVALIFPELNQQEVFDRTQFIRQSVRLYRWGMQKYTEIKERFLAPADPPLVVDEEDYDLPEKYRYIPADEGYFVLVSDFKKVLSYGNDPRDFKAMQARKQRILDQKTKKTSFDKFRSMVAKLEFSKIPYYGTSLPNPFVGNAGIGSWKDNRDYRARLIADTAEIADKKEIMGAVHIQIPGHRFMLANQFADNLSKPSFEVVQSENVKNIRFLYPLPQPVVHSQMIAGYNGDLAFPFTFETIDPAKEVLLTVRLTLGDCDSRLDCRPLSFDLDLYIAAGPENEDSSVEQFIRQSYYNLPREQNKNFKLEKLVADTSADGRTVEQIRAVFEYDDNIRNFTFLLEDNLGTLYSAPKISFKGDKIYVSLKPLTNQDKILEQKVIILAQLNNYNRLRQNIVLQKQTQYAAQDGKLKQWLLCLAIGLGFYLMPLGFPFLGLKLNKANSAANMRLYFRFVTVGIVTAIGVAVSVWYAVKINKLPWGRVWPLHQFSFLSGAFLWISGWYTASRYKISFAKPWTALKGFIAGVMTVLLLPLANIPGIEKMLIRFDDIQNWEQVLLPVFFTLGLCLPYLWLSEVWYDKPKQRLPLALKKLFSAVSQPLIYLMLAYVLVLLFMQMRVGSFAKQLLLLAAGWVVFNYGCIFLQALAKTRLSKEQKIVTEKVVWGIIAAVCLMIVWASGRLKPIPTQSETEIDMARIDDKIKHGKIVLVAVDADWCVHCRINEITVLTPYNIERWRRMYNFEYLEVDATDPSPSVVDFLKRYNQITPPLYVLFSYQLQDGLVLSDFLNDADLSRTIADFEL